MDGPDWSQSDRDVAVAWHFERQLVCSGCGKPRDETMAKENTFAYRARPVRCHACKAVAEAQKKFTSQPHEPGGLTWAVDGGCDV